MLLICFGATVNHRNTMASYFHTKCQIHIYSQADRCQGFIQDVVLACCTACTCRKFSNERNVCKLERRAQDSDTCNIFAEVAEPKLSLADANPSLV